MNKYKCYGQCKDCKKMLLHKRAIRCRQCNDIFKVIPAEKRFWKFVLKGDNCWKWIGSVSHLPPRNYGTFNGGYAHRFSYELHKGKIEKGMEICHSCDNPPCVNPNHLFKATHSDNMKDAVSKGRIARGDKSSCRKLSESNIKIIRDLRKDGWTNQKISEKFKVDSSTISRAISGDHWGHI